MHACVCVSAANGFTMSTVNASGLSGTPDDSSVLPNYLTYQVPSTVMEPGFDGASGTYMQHGNDLHTLLFSVEVK